MWTEGTPGGWYLYLGIRAPDPDDRGRAGDAWRAGPFPARPWAFARRAAARGPGPGDSGRTGRTWEGDLVAWAAAGRHVATTGEGRSMPTFLWGGEGDAPILWADQGRGPCPPGPRRPGDPGDRDPAGDPTGEGGGPDGDPEGTDPRGLYLREGGRWLAAIRLDAERTAGLRGPGGDALRGDAARGIVRHGPHLGSPAALVAAEFLGPGEAANAAGYLAAAWAETLGGDPG